MKSKAVLTGVIASIVAISAANAHEHKMDGYANHVLVSNGAVPADHNDPNMINSWGIAFNPTAVVWVNQADAGKSTLYDGAGNPQKLVVTVPGPNGEMGNPTGIVFSGGNDFSVTDGKTSAPARFIFATENGSIAGWAPSVNPTVAITAVKPIESGTVYTGLALSGDGNTHLLYAANFSHARVDVFDGSFSLVHVAGGFYDRYLPPGYAPFGIQALGGDIYVTFAKQSEDDPGEEEQGPGRGFVDVFDPQGHLIRRVASRGALNAPWGLALAPASFGRFGGALLVGNLGDGTINAYGPISGTWLGTLRDSDGKRLHIDGLWGIAFGNGVLQQKTNALYYAAGPDDEAGGAYGVITVDN